jgi:hypothetical protein
MLHICSICFTSTERSSRLKLKTIQEIIFLYHRYALKFAGCIQCLQIIAVCDSQKPGSLVYLTLFLQNCSAQKNGIVESHLSWSGKPSENS